MPNRDISPVPDSPKPQGTGHYRAEDDIELPPMPNGDSTKGDTADWPSDMRSGAESNVIFKSIGAAILLGAVFVGGWFAIRGGSLEKQHENWQHVAAAAKASTDTENKLVFVDGSKNSETLSSIEVTSADADHNTTQQVRMALQRNDMVAATAMLQSGQRMPSVSGNSDAPLPELTADSEVSVAIKEGRKELYQIELFDCCDEDGDIVEVIVNGIPFSTVPIFNGGTMLSIPLGRGNNTVTIRGVKDGGGGVTLSFRTSRGDYFARYMAVGEEYSMGVVVQ